VFWRKIIAIAVGKLAIIASRLVGRQGTDLPGRIALRICPRLLKELAENVNEEIFVVTGTNGKTTTSNMIAAIIRGQNYSLVHNRAGANMISGITSTFVEYSNILGNRRFDYALLETDEANVPLLLKHLTPRVVLITNFFRDQLDRFGELDNTINLIKNAVRGTDIELVLNADDPLVAHFHNDTGLHCWYYGFADTIYDHFDSRENREGRFCVFCGHELQYERYHYAQLGKYNCPGCGSRNPKPNFIGHDLVMNPSISFKVNNMEIESPYQGFYNAYNILAAVSVAKLVGVRDKAVKEAIAAFKPQAGRLETFNIAGKKTVLILVKNPTGLNQTLSMLTNDPASKDVFIALNDNAADGRDISWIWDADVEVLSAQEARVLKIVCSGLRSADMALRVKYAGIDTEKIIIESDLKEGICATIKQQGEVSYILSTYTALFNCRKILVKLEQQRPGQNYNQARRAVGNN